MLPDFRQAAQISQSCGFEEMSHHDHAPIIVHPRTRDFSSLKRIYLSSAKTWLGTGLQTPTILDVGMAFLQI
jgi:hypothetical protein